MPSELTNKKYWEFPLWFNYCLKQELKDSLTPHILIVGMNVPIIKTIRDFLLQVCQLKSIQPTIHGRSDDSLRIKPSDEMLKKPIS